ncbi:glutamate-gated chloride channel alpha-like [Centruroides sculpturatus]|uniref:glutamate-gated chloride channel alpha-like n=1 Tax=Centruroides sculpturatus TaxID=218467 RepID=UPI000C6CA58F|nr:glutamate-gated chloride channel alpha-like [Centruroides sculpturatus]
MLVVVVLLFYPFVSVVAIPCDGTDPFKLIVPLDYRKSEAPATKKSPVPVYVGIQIFDIYDLNEETMDYNIHMYFDDVWKDYRLNSECLKENRPVIFPEEMADRLWTPDIYFENSKWGELFRISVPNINVKIYRDGTLYRSARYVVRLSCPMNLRYYPMDVQVCSFKIGLFAHPNYLAELHWSEEKECPKNGMISIEMLSPTMLPQFDLINVSTGKTNSIWSTGNYTSLIANFTFSRHLTSHIVNTYIPSSLVVALSWLSFWLRVGDVPARVTLGVTSLLTLSTQIVQSRSNLPPVAYVNALDVWLFVCVNMVFFTIVEYGFCYYLAENHFPSSEFFGRIQMWLTKSCDNVAPTAPLVNETKCTTSQQKTKQWQKGEAKTQSLDRISRILFPITFLLFNIFYWPYYLSAHGRSSSG